MIYYLLLPGVAEVKLVKSNMNANKLKQNAMMSG